MNAETHPAIVRASDETPVDVQPAWIAIDLDHHAALACLFKDAVEVHRVALAREQQSSGEVTDEGDEWAVERSKDPLGHFFLRHAEPRMDRCANEIELHESVHVVIDAAVGEDVRFGSTKHSHRLHFVFL